MTCLVQSFYMCHFRTKRCGATLPSLQGLHFRLQVRCYDGLRVWTSFRIVQPQEKLTKVTLAYTSCDLVGDAYNEFTIDPQDSTGHGRCYSFHMFLNNQRWRQCARQTMQHADGVHVVVSHSLQDALNIAAWDTARLDAGAGWTQRWQLRCAALPLRAACSCARRATAASSSGCGPLILWSRMASASCLSAAAACLTTSSHAWTSSRRRCCA